MKANFLTDTRSHSDPAETHLAYLSCHPDDIAYLGMAPAGMMGKRKFRVHAEYDGEGSCDHAHSMREMDESHMIVLPVTENLLDKPCEAVSFELGYAVDTHIPIFPLMPESVTEELYNKKGRNVRRLKEVFEANLALVKKLANENPERYNYCLAANYYCLESLYYRMAHLMKAQECFAQAVVLLHWLYQTDEHLYTETYNKVIVSGRALDKYFGYYGKDKCFPGPPDEADDKNNGTHPIHKKCG